MQIAYACAYACAYSSKKITDTHILSIYDTFYVIIKLEIYYE